MSFSLLTEEIGRALEKFGLNSHSVPVWAVVWTGLITTALNRLGETAALGKMSTSEASVLLATEPLFAAVFGFFFTNESFGPNDYVGGVLIIGACFANTLKKEQFAGVLDTLKFNNENKD